LFVLVGRIVCGGLRGYDQVITLHARRHWYVFNSLKYDL